MKLPVIIIFDVDGTLLGDVSSLLTFWLSIKDKMHYDCVQENIKSCLGLLIRPGVADLMRALNKKYQHVEYFIYSAGREEWLEVIIPCMEEILGVSFNRPLFGRSYCIIGYKMLELVSKNILRIVQSKYRGHYSQDNIRKMVVIFDDNPQVFDNMHDFVRVIKCPCYKTKIHINVLEKMGEEFCRKHFEHLSLNYLGKKSDSFEQFVTEYDIYRKLCADTQDNSDFFGQLDLDEVDKVLFS